jgi:membrane associated rhomboid family serine protease
MAIPIPIGHTGAIRRFPVITVGLIIINSLVFLATTKVIEKSQYHFARKAQELIVYEIDLMKTYDFTRYKQYINDTEMLNLEAVQRDVNDFREEIKAGRVVEKSTMEFKRWKALFAAYEDATESSFLQKYGFVPAKFNISGLFTSIYLHGGWLHLIGNMLFLWVMGGAIEDKWGIPTYIIFYHLSGVAASLTHYLADRASISPTIGASGAIAGLMGAFLIRHYKTKIKIAYLLFMYVGKFQIPAWLVLPIWLGDQYFNAITYKGMTGVAVWAHIGGFLFGVVFAIILVLSGIERKFLTPPASKSGEEKVWKKEESVERETLDKNIEIGRELAAKGKYADALISFNAAFNANPGNLEALKLLYFTYLKIGNMEEVVQTAARIMDLLIINNRYEETAEVYREVKKVNPKAVFPVRTQYNIARTLHNLRMFPEAARAYYEFSVTYPENQIAPKAMFAAAEVLLLNMNDTQNSYKILTYLNQKYPSHMNMQKATEYINQIESGRQSSG